MADGTRRGSRRGWPGNVRQLIKVLRRSVYLELPLSEVIDRERELGALIAVEAEETGRDGLWPLAPKDIRPMREVRREYAARALELHAGNYTVTARALGIAINTLKAYLACAFPQKGTSEGAGDTEPA
jgi:transcriptional regulator with PAS, ATPase and Fis domain